MKRKGAIELALLLVIVTGIVLGVAYGSLEAAEPTRGVGRKNLADNVHRVYDAELGVACYWITSNFSETQSGATALGISCVKVTP